MKLNSINSINLLNKATVEKTTEKTSNDSFFNYLKNALGQVDDLQKQAAFNAEKLALGDETFLHNTMIAYEKANLSLLLTIEIRNKLLEAYQEIMRIQM